MTRQKYEMPVANLIRKMLIGRLRIRKEEDIKCSLGKQTMRIWTRLA
jgi:hypothetical protein